MCDTKEDTVTHMLENDTSEEKENLDKDLNENVAVTNKLININTNNTDTTLENKVTVSYKASKEIIQMAELESNISEKAEHKQDINIHQQQLLDESNDKIRQLKEKCCSLEQSKKDVELKLEIAIKQKDLAVKEKESMVIKYAVSEKHVLQEKQGKEQLEKKLKEVSRENEILLHKVQTMNTEKARICQMLDNKCYEYKTVQQDLDKTKNDLNALETKLKWSQNSLKTEIEAHKECQAKVEYISGKLQNMDDEIQKAKTDAQEYVRSFRNSEENRANMLDEQYKEQQATLILLKHEKDDKEQQVKTLQQELERLQTKQNDVLQENNELSLKIQHLERDRLETQQKLSELRGCADQQRQDAADLQAKNGQLEQLKLQLQNEHDQLNACQEQMSLLKQRNSELESDMEACRFREAELLLFTQQLTDKNVRLQSEFTSMETKVQQLACEQAILKRAAKEHETKGSMLSAKIAEDRVKYIEENESLSKKLEESLQLSDKLKQEVADQKGENNVVKRKLELSLREVNKELHHCRKRIEQYESMGNTSSGSSSSSSNCSLHGGDKSNGSPANDQVQVIQPVTTIDKETLIDRIVKLQRINARKSEKIDFLEEHVNTLIAEVQKKSRLLQSYILREQSGTLTSNSMDNNKANLAKLNGVMASVYSSRVADNNLTLELSLDINRKLQAVLEDALLKNITLKENVDTLGAEIDRLSNLRKI